MFRAYTSCTKYYLPKARVMAKTLKKFHPDWPLHLVFSDSLPKNFNLEDEPFDDIILIEELDIPNFKQWLFKHTIVELCTAVKGASLARLLEMPNTQGVFYLDPDLAIFNDLGNLTELLAQYDILLTPHLLHPEDEPGLISGNEVVTTLAHGIYNLGFLGVAATQTGGEFAKWWEKRLLWFCQDNVPGGLFTDQRWCDFIPSFFETYHIIRDPGYNVATWNIRYRPITRDDDAQYLAGGYPLRFYHFTGYDAGYNYENLLKQFAKGYPAAFEIWEEYASLLANNGHDDASLDHWEYGSFDNGRPILKSMRVAYRNSHQLQEKYKDPFDCSGPDSFINWCEDKGLFSEDTEVEAAQITQLKDELDAIKNSASWKITKPLRLAQKLMRRIK